MIIEIGKDKINEILDFSWDVYCIPEFSSFTRYENKESMESSFIEAINHPDDKLLACYGDGALTGVFNLFVGKESKYLQSEGVYIRSDYSAVMKAFLAYITDSYSGYDLYLGFPKENESAAVCMKDAGAELVDSCVVMNLTKDEFTYSNPDITVKTVTRETFADYAAFHDAHYPGIYWTGARINDKFDVWKIYTIEISGVIAGSIFISVWDESQAEVYGVSVDASHHGKDYERALLMHALHDIFSLNKESVIYFCDDDNDEEIATAQNVGFRAVDSYRCYKLTSFSPTICR